MGLFNGLYKNYGMSKEKVLEWQKLVTGSDIDKVKLSKEQLKNGTEMIIDSHRKIINDCIRLINSTITPGVFFDRYDMLIKEMTELIPFEPFYSFKQSISGQVEELKQKRSLNEKAFINKYFKSVIESTENLKTKKGKENRINKYFEIMETYKPRMTQDAIEHLDSLHKNVNN